MRILSCCLLVSLTALAAGIALFDGSSRADATSVPTLPELPMAVSQPRLAFQASARVELLELATALTQQGAISLNTPLRSEAFGHIGDLTNHPAVSALRELKRQGLDESAWLSLILAHGEPPRLSPRRPVDRWLPTWGGELSERERQRQLQEAVEALGELYKASQLQAYFDRNSDSYAQVQATLASALPGEEPMDELVRRLGGGGQAVLIVPSPLARRTRRLTLPSTVDGWETHVTVLALPDGQLPYSELEQAALRYEAVAGALARDLLARYEGELQQAGRTLNEARRVISQTGISLDLSGADVINANDLEASVLRALFLRSLAGKPWQAEAEASARRSGPPGAVAMAATLESLDAEPLRYPDLDTQLPLLLDAAIEQGAGRTPAPISRWDLNEWEGRTPVGWSINAPSVPAGTLVPTEVERIAVDRQGRDLALRLSATSETNQWRELVSTPVVVGPGDHVKLTGRLRTDGVVREPGQLVGAHLFLRLRGSDGKQITRVASRSFSGTNPWSDAVVEIEVPAGTAAAEVGAYLGMTGTADFDQLQLEVARPDAGWFLRDGGFEVPSSEGAAGWERFLIVHNSVDGPSLDSVLVVDPGQRVLGNSSLKLAGSRQTSRWYGARSQLITSKPGRRVVLTGYVRAEGVGREGVQTRNAQVSLEFLNERGAVVGTATTAMVDGSYIWKQVRLETTAPLDTVWVRVTCALTVSGALWFDALHVSQR